MLRKPLLTKSNTTPVKRSDYVRKKVYPGIDTPAQENTYVTQSSLRRLCQINASPLANKNKAMASNNGEQSPAASPTQPPAITPFIPEADTSANMSELGAAAGSPRGSQGEASRVAMEPISDAGSENLGSPRVSEAEVMSESDEFRSVGESHSQSRFGSHPKDIQNRASSRLSLFSVASALSFATAGSWEKELEDFKGFEHDLSEAGGHEIGSSQAGQSIDQYIAAAKARHRHHKHHSTTENLFPDSFEGTDFLVGGADATDLSFLEAGAADPEEIGGEHHDEDQHDNDELVKQFNPLETHMAQDYVNYNRGSGDTGEEQLHSTSGDAAVADIAEDQGDGIGDIQITPAAVPLKEDITSSQEFPPLGDGIPPEALEDNRGNEASSTEGLSHGHGSEDESAARTLLSPSDGDVEGVSNTTGTTQNKDVNSANNLAVDSGRGGDDTIIGGPSSEAEKEAVDDMLQPDSSSDEVPSHIVENGGPEVSASPPHENSANADPSVDQGHTIQEMGSNKTSEEETIATATITGSVEGAPGEVISPELDPVSIPESGAPPYDVTKAVERTFTSVRDAAEVGSRDGEREVATESGNSKEVEEGKTPASPSIIALDDHRVDTVTDSSTHGETDAYVPEVVRVWLEEHAISSPEINDVDHAVSGGEGMSIDENALSSASASQRLTDQDEGDEDDGTEIQKCLEYNASSNNVFDAVDKLHKLALDEGNSTIKTEDFRDGEDAAPPVPQAVEDLVEALETFPQKINTDPPAPCDLHSDIANNDNGSASNIASELNGVGDGDKGNGKGVAEETDHASTSETHGPSSDDAENTPVELDTAPQSKVESNGANSPESEYGEPSSQLSEDSEGPKDVDTVEAEDQVSTSGNTEDGEASTSRSSEDQRQMDAALLDFTMGGTTEASRLTDVKGQGAEDSQDLEILLEKTNSVQAVNCRSNGDIQIAPPSMDTEDIHPGKDLSSSSRQSNGDLRSDKPARDKGAGSTKKTVAFALEPITRVGAERKIDEKDENHVGGRYSRPGRAQVCEAFNILSMSSFILIVRLPNALWNPQVLVRSVHCTQIAYLSPDYCSVTQ